MKNFFTKLTLFGLVLFFAPLTAFSAIDFLEEFIEPINFIEAGVRKDLIQIAAKQVDYLPDGEHAKLIYTIEKDYAFITLLYTPTALKKPAYMLLEIAMLNRFGMMGGNKHYKLKQNEYYELLGPSVSQHAIGELIANANAGDLTAKRRLNRWKLEALKNLTISNEFEKQFPGSKAYLEKLKNNISKDLQNTTPQSFEFTKGTSEHFLKMILANDRAGVADYLQKITPWKLMLPTAQKTVQGWIDAIRKPIPSKTILVYRGISFKEKGIPTQLGQNAFLAPFLNRDFKNVFQFEERYVKALISMGDTEFYHLKHRPDEIAIRITETMHRHAVPLPDTLSLYLSTSIDLNVAEGFVSGTERFEGDNGALLAMRIDQRRLIPNIASIQNELEYLIPIIIFPDEIVVLQENYSAKNGGRAEFLKKLHLSGENETPSRLWREQAFKFCRDLLNL